MKVEILIKHYKYEDLTTDCLDSIRLMTMIEPVKIKVIDSTPDTTFMYQKPLNYSLFTIDNSIGLIESFNRFIDPEYDLHLCLNNDVYVHPRFLTSIVQSLERYPEIGIIAPMYDQPGGGILEYPAPPFDWKTDTQNWSDYLSSNLPKDGSVKFAEHVDNCAWGFTKELITKIGLPDGNFPGAGWFANQDYCYRAKQAGFKVAACLGSFIHHNHRGTYNRLDMNYATKAQQEGYEYACKKYGGKLAW